MNATQLAAWVGAGSGLGSLFWNIYTKVTAGPRLRVTAHPDSVMRPAPINDPHYLQITVRNVGTQPTVEGILKGDYPGQEFYLGGLLVRQVLTENIQTELKTKGVHLFRMAAQALNASSIGGCGKGFLEPPKDNE